MCKECGITDFCGKSCLPALWQCADLKEGFSYDEAELFLG
jgi:hypothetical protein